MPLTYKNQGHLLMFSQRESCQNLTFCHKKNCYVSVIVDVCQIGFCQKLILYSIKYDENKTVAKTFMLIKYQDIQGCLLLYF